MPQSATSVAAFDLALTTSAILSVGHSFEPLWCDWCAADGANTICYHHSARPKKPLIARRENLTRRFTLIGAGNRPSRT